ncbi:MAG: hypothetical protein MK185_17710, partial [Saccharospirillaceae bacterium]|nr:hypothetical protein [Saccharospirillaceae bacterium]
GPRTTNVEAGQGTWRTEIPAMGIQKSDQLGREMEKNLAALDTGENATFYNRDTFIMEKTGQQREQCSRKWHLLSRLYG